MTNKSKTGLALLEETLEIYGADRTRWPLEVRRALSGLLSENADARRLLAEGEAIDRLLDLAPAIENERVLALSGRIAAASRTTPRMAATANLQAPKPSVWTPRRTVGGMAMAASLVLGIVAGQSVQMAPAVNELAAAVGIDASSEVASGNNTVALGDDAETVFDEDLL